MGHSLKRGTVLDGKYRIEKVIGQGGFGITYEGVMEQHTKTRVAVKELFLERYMQRDTEVSDEICLRRDSYQASFEKAREDFLKEAVIIGMLNKEPAVVNVMDRFKANGTAYIVMEFVQGQNLAQYVKEHGVFEDREIFRRMLPMISTMKKVHENEVLHCDISPENIMVQEDGSFKLIDFGAARNYAGYEEAVEAVKEGYAPAEQYDAEGKTGPWTDVYALCATIYYCITGKTPESAGNRLLFDELEKPSQMGIRMEHGLENILWKGFAVDWEKRYQSMEELEQEIRKIIPERSFSLPVPFRIGVIAALILLVAATAFTGWKEYKERNKFNGIETQTMVLVPDQAMTVTDYVEATKVVEERCRILAGDAPYSISQDGEGKLSIVMPLSVFGENDAEDIYDRMIAGIWNTELGKYEESKGTYLRCGLDLEDIISARLQEGVDEEMSAGQKELLSPEKSRYVKLKLTEEKAKELEEIFPEDYILYLYFDFDSSEIIHNSVSVSVSEDRSTCYLFGSFIQEGQFGKLLEYNLTHEGFEEPFQMYGEIAADWESPDNSMMTGEHQCREEDIGDPAVTISYVPNGQYGRSLSKGEWAYLLVTLKERLDALQIPYAIGSSRSEEQEIVLKTEKSGISAFRANSIMEKGYAAILAGKWSEYGTPLSERSTMTELIPLGDGTYQYSVSLAQEEWKQFEGFTEDMLERGETELYIKIGSYYLAQCSLSSPVENGQIMFTAMCDRKKSSITEENKYLFQYLDIFAQDNGTFSQYSPDKMVFTDEAGDIDTEGSFQEEAFVRDFAGEFKEKVKELCPQAGFEQLSEYNTNEVSVNLNLELSDEFVGKALEMIEEIYEKCEMEEGWLNNITFVLTKENTADSESARVYFIKQQGSGKRDYSINVLFQNGRMEWYKTEMTEQVKKNEFFRERLGIINGWKENQWERK